MKHTEDHAGHTHHGHGHGAAPETVVRDAVCGMTVDPAAGKPSREHGGRLFHFSSASCRGKFQAAPDKYVSAKDPVCGMDVARDTARHFPKHEGTGYCFCSSS
jgi:Cu+-exporting ATPase